MDVHVPGHDGGMPQADCSSDPPLPAPTSAAGGIKERGVATPQAHFVRRVQSPRVQVMS